MAEIKKKTFKINLLEKMTKIKNKDWKKKK